MVEGFAPHVGGEEPLRNLGMTECCAALLPLAFSLQGSTRKDGKQKLKTTAVRAHALFKMTYDGISLQRRGTSVEHEDGLDPIEEEFADPTEEAQDVCIDQGPALLITHGGLELVDPDAGVDGKCFALHGFQPFKMFSACPPIRQRKKENRTILADPVESTNPTKTSHPYQVKAGTSSGWKDTRH